MIEIKMGCCEEALANDVGVQMENAKPKHTDAGGNQANTWEINIGFLNLYQGVSRNLVPRGLGQMSPQKVPRQPRNMLKSGCDAREKNRIMSKRRTGPNIWCTSYSVHGNQLGTRVHM